jgi:hypothetical protein
MVEGAFCQTVLLVERVLTERALICEWVLVRL